MVERASVWGGESYDRTARSRAASALCEANGWKSPQQVGGYHRTQFRRLLGSRHVPVANYGECSNSRTGAYLLDLIVDTTIAFHLNVMDTVNKERK